MAISGFDCDGCGNRLKGDEVMDIPPHSIPSLGDLTSYPALTLTEAPRADRPAPMRKYELCRGCFAACEQTIKQRRKETAS